MKIFGDVPWRMPKVYAMVLETSFTAVQPFFHEFQQTCSIYTERACPKRWQDMAFYDASFLGNFGSGLLRLVDE